MNYFELGEELQNKILEDRASKEALLYKGATKSSDAVRLYPNKVPDHFRSPFEMDIDKILHNPFYNRLTDKTQVFSLFHNDDLTRRALHVQLVSRIAEQICERLNLNVELARAIALGHDLGHTPFGHSGERFLSEQYHKSAGRYFNHNVHSVRCMMNVIPANLTLQTYDGIICHNGEKDFEEEYYPSKLKTPEEFLKMVENCYIDESAISHLRPATLEGCVVRICDVIAYVAKDRQDALRVGITPERAEEEQVFGEGSNSDVISKCVLNIVKNSYGKPYIKMDAEVLAGLMAMKKINGKAIYGNSKANKCEDDVRYMMEKLYEKLLKDRKEENKESILYTYHMKQYHDCYFHKGTDEYRENIIPDDAVVDFIASMTDDYFIALFKELFPEDPLSQKDFHKSYAYNMQDE